MYESSRDTTAHKLENTNFVSKFLFAWMRNDVTKAYKSNWEQSMHSDLPKQDEYIRNFPRVEARFLKQTSVGKRSLLRALFLETKFTCLLVVFYSFFFAFLQILSVYLIKSMIVFLQSRTVLEIKHDIWSVAAYMIGILVASTMIPLGRNFGDF